MYLNSARNLLKAFEWYHDPIFAEINISQNRPHVTLRKSTLDEMTTWISKISQLNGMISSISEKLNSCETNNILKRLGWASASNPSLNEAVKSFELMRKNRHIFVDYEVGLYNELNNLLVSWSNFELLRTKQSRIYTKMLESFECMISTVEGLDLLEESRLPKISDVELTLMNFQSFSEKKPLTNALIQEYYKLLYDEVAQLKKLKQKEEKEYQTRLEEINRCLVELKTLLSQHNKIMSDVKPLLKTMSKYNDNNTSIMNYSKIYQTFSENCQHLVRCLSTISSINPNLDVSEQLDQLTLDEIKSKLRLLEEIVPKVYDHLALIKETVQEKKSVILESMSSSAATSNLAKTPPPTSLLKENSKTGKVIQECNSHAISVWKKIYQKLDGKDLPDSTEKFNVQEQVY